jgi:hypothetical protein
MSIRTKVPVRYKNPHASEELTLGLDIIENTPIEEINGNIIENSATYDNWLAAEDEHDQIAILIGGGDSINDHIEDIQNLQREGGIVFAMNGASNWAREHGISVDYQLILDAKEETSTLVDQFADEHLFASQCHPKTLYEAENLTLWHLIRPGLEELFPPAKIKEGGYALVGGDSSVGVCALCAVYIKGFRELHIFGYDTSYRDGKGHGYKQRINDTMPTISTEWAGKQFTISLAMREQCQNFMAYSSALKEVGCNFHLYGEGLLQTVYNTNAGELSERDKYRLMWMFEHYRIVSPGEHIADFYVSQCKPEGRVIDFGCGTGKGSVRLKELGLEPHLIDFADNCRDEEAADLPFMEWDLMEKIPAESVYGFCTDVMEHIPTKDVDLVINNIMDCSEQVFFQISTIDDIGGLAIGAVLHNTVRPHNWWKDNFKKLGYKVDFAQNLEVASLFNVSH